MIKSLFSHRQVTFKDKFVEAAILASGDKKASLDMTFCVISILSKMLHRLYQGFAKSDASEKAARTVAAVASVIVLSMQRDLDEFDVSIDSEQAVIAASTLVLTSVFNKSRADVDKFCQYGINAYKVILSNYGKNENVKSYFNDIYHMTVNYIETHDDQYLESNKHIVIR